MSQENMSAKAAKAAAAAARQEAAAIEQKRQRKIRIIGGLVVVVVMAALIAIPVLTNKDAVVPSDAALPKGVTSDTFGVKVGSAWTAPDADKIPVLQIWEDFQFKTPKIEFPRTMMKNKRNKEQTLKFSLASLSLNTL